MSSICTSLMAVTVLFVIVSQIKINLTNAYAGSLAWSNFFARVTHSHPGRVVWLAFNVAIALGWGRDRRGETPTVTVPLMRGKW